MKFDEKPKECIYENWDEFISNPNIKLIKNKDFKFKRSRRTSILTDKKKYYPLNVKINKNKYNI